MKGFWCSVMLVLLIPLGGPNPPKRFLSESGEANSPIGWARYGCEGPSDTALRERGARALVGVQGPIWRCDGRKIEMHWCQACLQDVPLCVGFCLFWCECKWTPGWYCESLPDPVWCPYGERCELVE